MPIKLADKRKTAESVRISVELDTAYAFRRVASRAGKTHTRLLDEMIVLYIKNHRELELVVDKDKK